LTASAGSCLNAPDNSLLCTSNTSYVSCYQGKPLSHDAPCTTGLVCCEGSLGYTTYCVDPSHLSCAQVSLMASITGPAGLVLGIEIGTIVSVGVLVVVVVVLAQRRVGSVAEVKRSAERREHGVDDDGA
ncbi:hypothetical protein HDU98_005446, partial [Podochytrium sp. JEL0797]